MNKRILFAVIITVILCGLAQAKTTITWWQFWTDPNIKPVIEKMVTEFEQANPDIDIQLTDLTWANGHEKIVIAFGSKTGPDIVELGSDWIAEFAANNLLMDMSTQVASDSADYEGWGMATYDGKVFARPWILGTRVLFANRDLLTQAGYKENFIPLTFEQLNEATKKIQALSPSIYGWGSNAPEKHRLYKKFLPFFWSHGAKLFSDDGSMCLLASDSSIKALKVYKELHDSCGFVADQRGIEDAFLEGKIGFIISGDWLLKRIELENRKINLLSSFIPGTKLLGKSFQGGEFLAVNTASKHPREAMRFIQFITSPENQVKFCVANRSANPSSLEAQKDDYFSSSIHLQTFIRQIKFANHPPVDPDWVYIEQAIEEAVENALFRSGLVAHSLYEARKKIEKIKAQ
ncbi:MAG: sugar ABC transporter substrate-binding protein [Candidatus Zixiibacteriota bacterium]|nr:MAG: sugar ABC transporter substrate-binding protein [candidate division Zixibacteria bacterium]